MIKKLSLLVLFISLFFVLALGSQKSQAKTEGAINTWTITKTTHPQALFFERDSTPKFLAGRSEAHLFWKGRVESGGNWGENIDDIFYTHLPSEEVVRLRDLVNSEQITSGYQYFLDTEDNLIMLINQNTDAGGSDLFLWKRNSDTPIHLNPGMGETAAIGYSAVVDSENQVHLLWVEEDVADGEVGSVYYWNEATASTQTLVSGLVYGSLRLRIHDDVLHAVWVQLRDEFATEPELVYWNSSNNDVELIRESASPPEPAFGYANPGRIEINEDGVFQLTWQEYIIGSPTYYYWNSSSKSNFPLPLIYGTLKDAANNLYFYI